MQGKIINGFELKRLLGIGGMAEVWYAENEIGKSVAVKILKEDLSHNNTIVERFRNEAVVMVKLDHPNIRQVYAYSNIDGRPCILMEYLEGNDLKALMKQGRRFTDEELRKWWDEIADALNYTHAEGIVHRDIKPSNLFLDKRGNIKLLDFGIAKIKESISMTQTGATMGTLMYMSPEQVDDAKHLGPQSDIYSLAVTFVHLLTGKAPYDSTTMSDYKIRKGIVEQPLDLSALPKDWQGFLAPYLEKDPAKRPGLRPFKAVSKTEKLETPSSDCSTGKSGPQSQIVDEGTIEATSLSEPSHEETISNEKSRGRAVPNTSVQTDRPKSKKGLWIVIGAVALALLLVLLLNPKKEPASIDSETQAYQACQTIEDYRAYMRKYGTNALHYDDAKAYVDQYVADSIQNFLAQQQAEVEMKKEDEAYQKCTTIAACDSYLKDYPNGRYVTEVQQKKAELEKNAPKNGSYNGHEYVDLCLPSGTLWATCNIGASKPEGYGNYYAWGETSTKSIYNWETYKYTSGSRFKLTKYCNQSDLGNNGFTDKLTTLQGGDDAATVNWGSGWQTPSEAQWNELLSYTTNQWTTRNGVKGRIFTSKKNGQAIFIPAAGGRYGSEGNLAGSHGRYWSRSLYEDAELASDFCFKRGGCDIGGGSSRDLGYTVRPVRKK